MGGWNPNIFVIQEPMQNCKTLKQPLLGELAMSPEEREREREKEREKMPFIVATYDYASSQGLRTHSAWTNKCKNSTYFGLRDGSIVHSNTLTQICVLPVKNSIQTNILKIISDIISNATVFLTGQVSELRT